LVAKTARAALDSRVTEVMIAGGVSANQALRQAMRKETDLPVRYPPLSLCTDNGAMIAAAGHYRYLAGLRNDLSLEVLPMWPLSSEAYELD
jgi:N6-L-threonylcarbamoyladenine synthase